MQKQKVYKYQDYSYLGNVLAIVSDHRKSIGSQTIHLYHKRRLAIGGDNNERLEINVKLKTNATFDDINNVVGRAFTIVHETFIHVDLFAVDWKDDGLMSTSNVSRGYYRYSNVGKSKDYGVSECHHYTALDAAKNLTKPDMFWNYGHRSLNAINRWYETGLNRYQAWDWMRRFEY